MILNTFRYNRIITILLLLLAPYAHSQTELTAKKILDDFSTKIQSHKSIQAEFTFSLENTEENMLDSFEGSILLKKEKYKLIVMGMESYFDGKTMWSFLPDIEEVTITEPDGEDDSMFNPVQIFNIYKEGYKLEFNGEKEGKYHISMYPNEKDQNYSKIEVKINKKSLQLLSVKYFGNDGNDYYVIINGFNTNQIIEDNVFVFNISDFPDVEVIDLR